MARDGRVTTGEFIADYYHAMIEAAWIVLNVSLETL